MPNGIINKELKRFAVHEKDIEKVKALLSANPDVNLSIEECNPNKETLLHVTHSVEITKQLLLRGAEVDKRDIYGETPLLCAIKYGKKLEIVRELLKNGADVNRRDRRNNTPLNIAVKNGGKNLELIKELLEYGANINIRNKETFCHNYNNSPLDTAVFNDLSCAKLLIKTTLIKSFVNYKEIIDLTPYRLFSFFRTLTCYLDDCIYEIILMKSDKIANNLSIYEFVTIKSPCIKTLHANNVADQLILTKYPIYYDVIFARVKLCLERDSLLNKLNELQIYVGSDISNQNPEANKLFLNFDSTSHIANYLSNDDVLNLITAFHKHNGQSLDYSGRVGTKLD